MATILLGACPYDPSTRYGYAYLKYLGRLLSTAHKIVVLRHANLPEFRYVLKTYDPQLVVLNGHGGAKGVTGCNGNVILGIKGYDPDLNVTIYRENAHWMQGRLVYLFTCHTGKELAPLLVDYGAVAVAAFKDAFLFLTDDKTNALKDKSAKPFFTAALQLPIHLALGRTWGESCEAVKNAFLYYVEKYERLGQEETAKYLWFNYVNFVCYGDVEARLTGWESARRSLLV